MGINWDKFDIAQFRAGMGVEFERGTVDPKTDVTSDDPLKTAKIALAHLNEFPDYNNRNSMTPMTATNDGHHLINHCLKIEVEMR